jgi:glycine cleavage system regulatory protein
VEELQSGCESAAMSGETLFRASAKLSIPDSCDVTQLRERLGKIAGDLIVEVSLEPLGTTLPD